MDLKIVSEDIIGTALCYSDCPKKNNCKTHYYNNEADLPQYEFYTYEIPLYGEYMSICGEDADWALFRAKE